MNVLYRRTATAIMKFSILALLLCGCQQKAPTAPPPTEGKTGAQLDTEYRAILTEAGLLGDGKPAPPAQMEKEAYGRVLLLAAGHGSVELLARLLGARGDINLNEKYDGRTLLHAAAAALHAANSNHLLERGLDPNAQDNLGRTPLHLVVARPQGDVLARLLLSRGAQIDIGDEQGMTPLLAAAPACVKLLADKGADLAARDRQGNSALHWAVYRKSHELADLLITLGAPLDIQNSDGKTALHHAVLLRDQNMAQLLLKAGAPADIADTGGQTPRQAAEKSGSKAMVDLFKQP